MHAVNPPYESLAGPRSRLEPGYWPSDLSRPEIIDTIGRTNDPVIPGSKYSRHEQLKQPAEDEEKAARKNLGAFIIGIAGTVGLIMISVPPEEAEQRPAPAPVVESGYYYDQEDGYYYLVDRE